ncbi:MAG: DUF4190 domain-containing protein [Planctomycetota bacterium]
MAWTCPSCRHPVEPPAEADAQRVKCGNCGAWVPLTPVTAPPVPAPVAQPLVASRPPQSGSAIAALVCSLIFFIPLVTQALAVGFGVFALVRKSPDGRRPAAAWAGVILGLLVGLGWTVLLINVSKMVTGGGMAITPYATTQYGGYGSWGTDSQMRRRQKVVSALERIGQATTAYRRDMGRWPERMDLLVPTYLAMKVLDDVDPDRAATDKRLVTWLADVDPNRDAPDSIVAYSVRIKHNDFGERLQQPERCVLRLNGQVEALPASIVEEKLARRGHRADDGSVPAGPGPANANSEDQ